MRFCNGEFSFFFGNLPASGNVKDSGYVAADTFLISNDLFLGNFNFAVDKNLVGAAVSHDCPVIVEKLVQAACLDYFLAEPFFVDVAVGDYGLAAEYVLEALAWYRLVNRVNYWEEKRCFYCGCACF